MRSSPGRTLALMLSLWAAPGCVALHPSETELPPAAPAAGTAELPPEKAAAVCLATAQTLEANGHEAQAIVQYEKARRCNPRLPVARRLAVLYDRQGDDTHALAEYQLAIEATPKDPDLLNDVGYFHYQRGNWGEAERYLRQATALRPNDQRAWVNLGLVLGHQGRYPESFDAFARVVPPARAHSNVGIIQAQQGKYPEAVASLRQALALEPTLKPAQVALARLENPPPQAGSPATAAAALRPVPGSGAGEKPVVIDSRPE